tara:strand:- start:50167 stop:50844 length:678 start_codon:yes stop_codon:yes gene_type:complete
MNYFMRRPLTFGIWFNLRRFKHKILRIPRRYLDTVPLVGDDHVTENVLPYNESLVWKISRNRTERLLSVLGTIGGIDKNNSKVLCIGPRNEAEVLLMSLYGFDLRKISAIDLFSYSPLIDIMDMHEMNFQDNQFDVLYSSYVLRYSNDIRLACSESVRVTKPNGLIAVAFVHSPTTKPQVGTQLSGGLKEMFHYFGDNVGHIFWQEELLTESGQMVCTSIFSVSK